MTHPDPELIALQERWSPQWKIWRARLDSDAADGPRTGSYMATLIDETAGIDPSLMARPSQAMHAALEAQAVAAAQGATSAPSPPLFS